MNDIKPSPETHYEFNGFFIKSDLIAHLKDYVDHGRPVGGFLTAVLENKLSQSVGKADLHSIQVLPALISYIYNRVPYHCWGSVEKVDHWISIGGMDGIGKLEKELPSAAEMVEVPIKQLREWMRGLSCVPNDRSLGGHHAGEVSDEILSIIEERESK